MSFKGISILGSTGSIGCNTLRVVEALQNQFRVLALAAGKNIQKLVEQIKVHRPELVSVESEQLVEELYRELRIREISPPQIAWGEAGMVEVATRAGTETVVSATVGAIGLVPTLRALEAGKRVALANKETLVVAGELMTRTAERCKATIVPVDSEHNALHQCLRGQRPSEVLRLILTASGGPFRTADRKRMEEATVEEAMRHPTWEMGAKITIDSATLMNKGLEVIEAHWLFGFDADRIDIIIHPESVVHSMIELVDGSIIAQLGGTDMRHAIQYALTYPERVQTSLPRLNLSELKQLTFHEPEIERFPCVSLAYSALRTGGTLPAVLNAANEVAVEAFIDGRIRLTDIPVLIERVMSNHRSRQIENLEQVIEADKASRVAASEEINKLAASSGMIKGKV
jgi:1-deoxy-D-xylulose-5-phosphate reductoisomerase